MVEWKRRLDDFDRKGWHNRVSVHGDLRVQYVGLVNSAGDEQDRVVLYIEATLDSYVIDADGKKILLLRRG